jgi:two-component system response regulator
VTIVVHIVMVEDNPPDVLVFREALRRRGIAYTLDHYANGEDAAEAIQAMTVAPDLFVVDLNIPRIHGLEVLRIIRGQAVTALAPVAILTSSQAGADKARANELGANLYLVKPDGFKEFVNGVGANIEEFLASCSAGPRFNEPPPGLPAQRGRRIRAGAAAGLRRPGASRRAGGRTRAAGSLR